VRVLVTMISGRQHTLDVDTFGFQKHGQDPPTDVESILGFLQAQIDSVVTVDGVAIDTHRIEAVKVHPDWQRAHDTQA
jgi:hypothetical protein